MVLLVPSVYVQTTVVEAVIGRTAVVVPVTPPKQLSVAVGGTRLVTLHCAVIVGKVNASATGAVVSATLTVATDEFAVTQLPF